MGMGVRTDVDGEVSNGWKEDLDIWTGDELGIHPSSVFEEGATQKGLGSKWSAVIFSTRT